MSTHPLSRRRRMRGLWISATVAGLLGAVVAGCHRGTHHGWHRSQGWYQAQTPEQAQERAREGADWILSHLDATLDQRQRIVAIVDESVTNLLPLQERHRAHRDALLEALSRPTIDRGKIEDLRKAELELADAASEWLADAALEAFEVLTPEQRAQVVEHARRRHQ